MNINTSQSCYTGGQLNHLFNCQCSKGYLIGAFFALGIFASSAVHAQTSDSKQQNVSKFTEISGLGDSIADLPQIIKSRFDAILAKGGNGTNQIHSEINAAIDDAINPKLITTRISDAVASSLTNEDINYMNTWYSSDLGMRITAAEKKSETPGAVSEIKERWQILMADTDRLREIKKIEAITKEVDLALEAEQFIELASYININAISGNAKSVNIDDVQYELVLHKPSRRARMAKNITITHLYAYQQISIDELHQYEDFLKDSRTINCNRVIFESFRLELKKSLMELTAKLSDVSQRNTQKV